MRTRAAIYYRVSSEVQNIACQRPEAEQLAKVRGYTVVRVYEEQRSAAMEVPQRRVTDDSRPRKSYRFNSIPTEARS